MVMRELASQMQKKEVGHLLHTNIYSKWIQDLKAKTGKENTGWKCHDIDCGKDRRDDNKGTGNKKERDKLKYIEI